MILIIPFPGSPLGNCKFNTWFGDVPVIVAAASSAFTTCPILKVFAGPVAPVSPCRPLVPACTSSSIKFPTSIALV